MSAQPVSSHRTQIAALALMACGISAYLSRYECGVSNSVWDPVFGARSSEAVLRSPLSRSLPVPDAVLGAVMYGAAGGLALGGGAKPIFVLLVNTLALTGVGQVLAQGLVVRRFCALCLSVGGVAFLNAWLARRETAEAAADLRKNWRWSAKRGMVWLRRIGLKWW